MKLLLFLLILSFNSFAKLEHCLRDAEDFGDMNHQKLHKSCMDLIKHHPDRIEKKSENNLYHMIGYKNLIYIDSYSSDHKLLKTEILAGDQTDLKDVQDFWIDEQNKRLIVLQSPNALLTFTLEYASNTSPLRHFKSPIINGVRKVQLVNEGKELAIYYHKNLIRFLNSDADTVRYKGGKFVPLLLRELHSVSNSSLDVFFSPDGIFVLDEHKIRIFDNKGGTLMAPRKTLDAPVKPLRILSVKDSEVEILLKSGSTQKVSFKPEST